MTKTAVPKPTADRSKTKADTSKKELSPSSQFIGAALSMGWQLALAVLVPVIGGFELDQHFNTSPLWTITGFIIAMVGTFAIIKKVLNEFNENINIKDKK
jgi:F0F1-type ATP synthase assembly protein I